MPPLGNWTAVLTDLAFDACGAGVAAGRNSDVEHAVKSTVHANAEASPNGKRPTIMRLNVNLVERHVEQIDLNDRRQVPSARLVLRVLRILHEQLRVGYTDDHALGIMKLNVAWTCVQNTHVTVNKGERVFPRHTTTLHFTYDNESYPKTLRQKVYKGKLVT